MMSESQATFFAPAERAPAERLTKQAESLENLYGSCSFFDALPNVVVVLNKQRQVIFCNQVLLDLLGIREPEEIKGYRLGEILRCVHACKTAGGCGTTEFCRTCGAVNAILESQSGRNVYHECRISVNNDGRLLSMDLGVTAIPFWSDGDEFTVLSITDISDQKRRRLLERIFFHDVMNTASGLLGLAELMKETSDPALVKEFSSDILSSGKLLVEQIQEQHDLMQAENNDLKVKMMPLHSSNLLTEVVAHCTTLEVSRGKDVQIDPTADNLVINSSPQLLYRVLVNMLKNALEACEAGEIVRLGCRSGEGQVEFWVNNPGVMSREVQLQLFQRSFSTKGRDRGLGTYSMKLLTERYLLGTISFSSSEAEGTTFIAKYPVKVAPPS